MQHQLLQGKRGIIFGVMNEQSLAALVAKQCLAEGAQIVLTNTELAFKLGTVKALAEAWQTPLIACDATSTEDLEHLLEESQRLLGGQIDFVLHACAMSQNLRRHRAYDDTNYTYFQQTLDISALSFHKLLQTAKRMDAIAEYGSVVALTYIAAQRHIAGYNDMSEAKAMLEAIARNFGSIYGEEKHVRINTVSQSPTETKAGAQFKGVKCFQEIADAMSALGNAPAQSCAELCVMLFSDYTRYVTMQNIFNDGGFVSTSLSRKYIDYLENIGGANDTGQQLIDK